MLCCNRIVAVVAQGRWRMSCAPLEFVFVRHYCFLSIAVDCRRRVPRLGRYIHFTCQNNPVYTLIHRSHHPWPDNCSALKMLGPYILVSKVWALQWHRCCQTIVQGLFMKLSRNSTSISLSAFSHRSTRVSFHSPYPVLSPSLLPPSHHRVGIPTR
jgi:hypothetical protein